MDLFVAICLDHHIDEVVRVFSTPELAIAYCETFADAYSRYGYEVQELDDDMIADGWLYFAMYGAENSVRVEKTTLDPED